MTPSFILRKYELFKAYLYIFLTEYFSFTCTPPPSHPPSLRDPQLLSLSSQPEIAFLSTRGPMCPKPGGHGHVKGRFTRRPGRALCSIPGLSNTCSLYTGNGFYPATHNRDRSQVQLSGGRKDQTATNTLLSSILSMAFLAQATLRSCSLWIPRRQ